MRRESRRQKRMKGVSVAQGSVDTGKQEQRVRDLVRDT